MKHGTFWRDCSSIDQTVSHSLNSARRRSALVECFLLYTALAIDLACLVSFSREMLLLNEAVLLILRSMVHMQF